MTFELEPIGGVLDNKGAEESSIRSSTSGFCIKSLLVEGLRCKPGLFTFGSSSKPPADTVDCCLGKLGWSACIKGFARFKI